MVDLNEEKRKLADRVLVQQHQQPRRSSSPSRHETPLPEAPTGKLSMAEIRDLFARNKRALVTTAAS